VGARKQNVPNRIANNLILLYMPLKLKLNLMYVNKIVHRETTTTLQRKTQSDKNSLSVLFFFNYVDDLFFFCFLMIFFYEFLKDNSFLKKKKYCYAMRSHDFWEENGINIKWKIEIMYTFKICYFKISTLNPLRTFFSKW
jgi:hypothetical protein